MKNVFGNSILLFLLLLSFGKGSAFGQFTFDFTSPKHTLIQVSTTDSQAHYAAELLQRYLAEMSGQQLEIVTNAPKKHPKVIVETDATLADDAYFIQVTRKTAHIRGGKGKGSTYAVIHLLEKELGCSYISPDCKIVPKRDLIQLPPKIIREEPKIERRVINIYFPCDQDYLDWNRLHTNEEYYPAGYFVHTFNTLLPWQEYFQEHPEYYALLNGSHSIDQLCPSHPEVLQIIEAKLRKEMAEHPDKTTWSVSQNDNFSYCHCDRCEKIIEQEGSPSGPIIHLVNQLAERFPDKIISTLAYQYSRKPPLVIKPRENVEIMFCSIELGRHKAIPDDPGARAFVNDMQGWGKIAQRIYVWDYTINFNHSVSPFPNLHVLQPNVQFFASFPIHALFEQSNSTIGYEFSTLKAFLLARLMWNPDIDLQQELKFFLHTYYGKAAPYIETYIQVMQNEIVEQDIHLDIYEHPTIHDNDLFKPELMELYDYFFQMAEEVVSSDSTYRSRVELAHLPLQYAKMEIATKHMFSDRGWYRLENGKPVRNEAQFNTLARFEKVTQELQVPTINENRLTPEAYVASVRRMIDIQLEGNLAFQKKVSATIPAATQYSSGDLAFLSNGVKGSNDYNVNWIGWFGQNTELVLDLEQSVKARTIEIGTLWNGKSWILHPKSIECFVSNDGQHYELIGTVSTTDDQKSAELIRNHSFTTDQPFRFVKFAIDGVEQLPDWHASAGQPAWFFVDEIVVR